MRKGAVATASLRLWGPMQRGAGAEKLALMPEVRTAEVPARAADVLPPLAIRPCQPVPPLFRLPVRAGVAAALRPRARSSGLAAGPGAGRRGKALVPDLRAATDLCASRAGWCRDVAVAAGFAAAAPVQALAQTAPDVVPHGGPAAPRHSLRAGRHKGWKAYRCARRQSFFELYYISITQKGREILRSCDP